MENYLLRIDEHRFTPSVVKREIILLDPFPTEYPPAVSAISGRGCLNVRNADGRRGCEIFYEGHEIYKGKEKTRGTAHSFGTEEEWERWI